jgi:hypothetical protein
MTHRSTQPARHIKGSNLMSFDAGPAVTDHRKRSEDPVPCAFARTLSKERRRINAWPRR